MTTSHQSTSSQNRVRLKKEFEFSLLALSVNVILFGWHQNANNKRVLNYILIITKYYIFTTSVCDNKLSFEYFLLHLNSKLDVQRMIAIKNKSLNKIIRNNLGTSFVVYLFIYLLTYFIASYICYLFCLCNYN